MDVSCHTDRVVFNLRQDLWTCSVLSDRNCEMKRVTESGQQGAKNKR